MEEHGYQEALAHLSRSVPTQADALQHRLALEWSQTRLNGLLAMWLQIDAHEALAYEDKVAAQVHILGEATATVRDLHRTLAAARCQRHQHWRYVRRDVVG